MRVLIGQSAMRVATFSDSRPTKSNSPILHSSQRPSTASVTTKSILGQGAFYAHQPNFGQTGPPAYVCWPPLDRRLAATRWPFFESLVLERETGSEAPSTNCPVQFIYRLG